MSEPAPAAAPPTAPAEHHRSALRRQKVARAIRMRHVYSLLVLSLGLLVVFKYVPIYGVLIAFKDFTIHRGIIASPWNDFEHFRWLFRDPFFFRVLFNTFWISVLRIIFSFPMPIILALMLNEVRSTLYKRTSQTISYLPHFISWVILGGILTEVLSPQRGIAGYIWSLLGWEPVNWLARKETFRGLLVLTGIWQGMGWGSIIYLAALSSVDPTLYEAAAIDGANRYHQARYVSLPSLIPAIVILFLLQVGNILEESFQQIFNLYNPAVYQVADVFSTYIYRSGIEQARYSYSTAVGLFQNTVGVVVLIGVNWILRRFSEYAIW